MGVLFDSFFLTYRLKCAYEKQPVELDMPDCQLILKRPTQRSHCRPTTTARPTPFAASTPLLEANVDRADLLPSSLPQLSSDAHTQDADPRQEITITQQSEQTVEEYRVGGRLYMIKITPKTGAPHYLVDDLSDGRFSYSQNIDPSFRSPRWVIRKF